MLALQNISAPRYTDVDAHFVSLLMSAQIKSKAFNEGGGRAAISKILFWKFSFFSGYNMSDKHYRVFMDTQTVEWILADKTR